MTTTTVPPTRKELAFVRLTNPTSRAPRGWVKVAVPYDRIPGEYTTFRTSRGLDWPAFRAFSVGTHSDIWAVRGTFAPNQTVDGHFLEPEPGPAVVVPFTPHHWVSDSAAALVMTCTIRIKGQDYDTQIVDGPRLETQSSAHQRWHTISKVNGFVLESWITVWSGRPVVDYSAALVWSDPTTPEPAIAVDGISLSVGEFPVLDFAARHGCPWEPVKADKWVKILSGPRKISDGSGLPLSGRLLCLPQNFGDPMPPDLVESLEELYAAYEAPLLGACDSETWNGRWLSHMNVARLRNAAAEQAMADKVTAWRFGAPVGGDWYDTRSLGCTKTPSQTGSQEDFGATKGTPAFFDPYWILQAQESVHADLFRGYCFHEASGLRMRAEDHPGWVTWQQRTHFPASTDTLGKRRPGWGEGMETGWKGYDDEHRSQNNLHAFYALTGDPIAGYLIERSSNADIACAAHKNGYIDSARAFGRRAGCYASVKRLAYPQSIEDARQDKLLEALIELTYLAWTGASNQWGMALIGHGIDERSGITYEGKPVPYWSPWTNAILAGGAYACWKATKDPRWLDVAENVSRTVTKWAYFEGPGGLWYSCDAVAWGCPAIGLQEGEPLPESAYNVDSTLVVSSRGGVADWQITAPLVFIETADPNDPELPRAKKIVEAFTRNEEATDQNRAEWLACVKSIPPVPQ